MSDSDDTPPGRPRARGRAQTSTERDIEGLRARAARHAAEEASLESERTRQHRERMARRTHPHGVAIPDAVERELGGIGEIEHEPTKPWDMLDREQLKPDELEIVRRSKRDSSDPAVFSDLAKVTALIHRCIDTLLKDRSTRKEQADAILELIKHPPNEAVLELQEDVKRIWRAFAEVAEQLGTPHSESKGKGTIWESIHRSQILHRLGLRLAGVALAVATGGAGYVVASIRSSERDEVLRAQDRKDFEELKQEHRELRRAFERERLKDKTPP